MHDGLEVRRTAHKLTYDGLEVRRTVHKPMRDGLEVRRTFPNHHLRYLLWAKTVLHQRSISVHQRSGFSTANIR